MYAWINLALLIISLILFAVFYSLSTMPVALSKKRGEKAWRECRTYRLVGSMFEMVTLVTMILWIWYPIPAIDWKISSRWWIGLIVGLGIIIPGTVIMIKGIIDAGKETLTPSQETEMYGGIYKYIRHPQTLGEMPMFPAIGFAVNSWFLVIVTFAYIILYVPIMLYFEEKDLIKRFGDSYRKYREETGALFPKWKAWKTILKKEEKS